MSSDIYISSSVVIRDGAARHDGKTIFERSESDVSSFARDLYKFLQCDYPKFYKMDNLCKLALVTTELLMKGRSIDHPGDETALVFSNSSASLDTDRTYFRSVEDKDNYFPSPAVFVYTLPNIMMGELCIRYKIHGENVFFVSEKFDAEMLADYSRRLIESGKASVIICGWIEINEAGWEAANFLIGKEGRIVLTPENLDAIYRGQ